MKNEIKAGYTCTFGNYKLKVMYINGRHLFVEKTVMLQSEPVPFLQLASIVDGKVILNLGNESEQHKYGVEKLKSIVDEWAKADEDKIRIEAERLERQKELERLASIRSQKFTDARELKNADVTEIKKLITEAKDFKAIRKNSRVSELLSEIAEIDILISLL
jgi:hypothetical protein